MYKEFEKCGLLRIYQSAQSICRVCGAADEVVAQVVSEYLKLAQKQYKQVRHDNVTKMLHWKLCEKWVSIKQKNGIYTNQKKF